MKIAFKIEIEIADGTYFFEKGSPTEVTRNMVIRRCEWNLDSIKGIGSDWSSVPNIKIEGPPAIHKSTITPADWLISFRKFEEFLTQDFTAKQAERKARVFLLRLPGVSITRNNLRMSWKRNYAKWAKAGRKTFVPDLRANNGRNSI